MIIQNKVALITGASRGIGRNIAIEFAKSGYTVVVNYVKSHEKAEEVKNTINSLGKECFLNPFDITKSHEVKNGIEKVISKYGRLDVLVNNAGIVANKSISNLTESEWDDVIRTNLTAVFYLIRDCSRKMSNPVPGGFGNEQKGGSIINISSIIGVRGLEGCSNYAAAKAGLISLTKTTAIELGRLDICVNAVLPGYHRTDMGNTAKKGYLEKIQKESCLGLTTDIDELSKFVVFLSGLKTVTGQVFNIDSRVI